VYSTGPNLHESSKTSSTLWSLAILLYTWYILTILYPTLIDLRAKHVETGMGVLNVKAAHWITYVLYSELI
jgi:hypothetical protein